MSNICPKCTGSDYYGHDKDCPVPPRLLPPAEWFGRLSKHLLVTKGGHLVISYWRPRLREWGHGDTDRCYAAGLRYVRHVAPGAAASREAKAGR